MIECSYRNKDGDCRGLYRGFGCIEHRCRADRQADCDFLEWGFYCTKFRRFGCVGPGNCGSLADYILFFRERSSGEV